MAEKGILTPYKSPAGVVKDSRKSGQGNLTGHVRKLKDIAAQLHNTINKWESLDASGTSILSDIVNTKLQYIYQQNDEKAAEEEQMDTKTLTEKTQPKFEALHLVIDSMEDVVKKLLSLTSMVHSIRSLSAHRGDSDSILFFSWTIHQFAETLDAVQAIYARELRLKRELLQNVAYTNTRSSLMCFSAAWVHQPNVDSKMMVTSLLKETGHVLRNCEGRKE